MAVRLSEGRCTPIFLGKSALIGLAVIFPFKGEATESLSPQGKG